MSRCLWLKIFSLCVVLSLVFGLCACGEVPSENASNSSGASFAEATAGSSDDTDGDVSSSASDSNIVSKPTARLIFEDNFDRENLFEHGSMWTNCTEWVRQDGGSKWCNELVEMRDGNLVLKAVWNAEDNRVDCGAVWTKDRFDSVGGYYEARIKFPVVKGLWGAFWLMAGNVGNADGSSVDGAEIDIIESIDNDKGAFQSAVHWDGYDSSHQMQSKSLTSPDIYDGEFHVFGFERAKGKYVFYVDGVKVWETAAAGLCSLPGYLMLSLEGTYSRGVGTLESIMYLPAEMEIDYVRVYASRPQ